LGIPCPTECGWIGKLLKKCKDRRIANKVAEELGMSKKQNVSDAVPEEKDIPKSIANSTIMAMLEALAEAYESKAEELLDSDEEAAEARAKSLQDHANAIREKLLP
jgi:hypothetical protein